MFATFFPGKRQEGMVWYSQSTNSAQTSASKSDSLCALSERCGQQTVITSAYGVSTCLESRGWRVRLPHVSTRILFLRCLQQQSDEESASSPAKEGPPENRRLPMATPTGISSISKIPTAIRTTQPSPACIHFRMHLFRGASSDEHERSYGFPAPIAAKDEFHLMSHGRKYGNIPRPPAAKGETCPMSLGRSGREDALCLPRRPRARPRYLVPA